MRMTQLRPGTSTPNTGAMSCSSLEIWRETGIGRLTRKMPAAFAALKRWLQLSRR